MTTLDRITIVSGITVFMAAWLMVAVSAWKLRRGRGGAWRRYRRGFLMIGAGVTLTEGRLLFRLPHEFTIAYVIVGAIGLVMAVSGFVVVVRAHQSEPHGHDAIP
jgi:hypothetical protein